MSELATLKQQLLHEGLDDYVGLWEIVRLVREELDLAGPDDVRSASLRLVEDLLESGLMEAGHLAEGGGFEAWSMPAREALARIRREWDALGRDPDLWEICWFSNTELGDRIAAEND